MSRPNIVAVSAGLWSPSKTTVLSQALASAAAEHLRGRSVLIEIGSFAAELGATFRRGDAKGDLAVALEQVERADVLIAASPVFRGSYTGHFKHFFDLVELAALKGAFVVVAAVGGGEKHCLVLEHALKPLFGFFQSIVLPSGVYASESDFNGGELVGAGVLTRIDDVLAELAALLQAPLSVSGEIPVSALAAVRAI